VVSRPITLSWMRRFALSHSSGKRSEWTNSVIWRRIAPLTPSAMAGASTSARSGSASRASACTSIFETMAVPSLSATAFCTAGLRAIGAMVLT
jgi:hypothetical protein